MALRLSLAACHSASSMAVSERSALGWGEMKPAEIEKECAMTFDGNVSYKSKVKIEPHCIYGQALNLKNWEKKINKMK